MSEQLLYSRAPITEAIIDLRIASRSEFGIEQLRLCVDSEKVSYPKRETISLALGKMEIGAGGSTSATAKQEQIGFKLSSADGKYVWQARHDGFTLSRLAPYEDWNTFCCEARRLWQNYRASAEPVIVDRVAVRYINRIDLPHRYVELKEYFRTSPEVSPELPPTLSGFFMQLQLPQTDLKGHLLIHQTIVPPDKPNVIPVILDIDLFRSDDVPNVEEEIWGYFEKLRIRKDEVFEACITDKTRELIR